ncbi:DUF4870 domain-containing protein [Kribbia dieselivorans]|uniref:DUF4870 domain-containing protein n=1 Tax=Kribbia dieselivorans TaxID=331526 RepID=UPI0008397053|nr:DUF4870 domain-containing protein [Kribbia dieselivorans]
MTEQHQQPQQPQQPTPNPGAVPPPGAAPVGATPPTEMAPGDQKTMGMLAHLIPLAAMYLSAGTLGFVASIVMWALTKDRGAFVAHHARNSLNVQLTTLIAYVVAVVLAFTIILIPVSIVLALVALVASTVIHIIAAIKAANGEWYRPPLMLELIK